MPNLRSREVGNTPVLPEIRILAEVEDKTPSTNPQTTMTSGSGSTQISTPGSGNPGCTVRRSLRILNNKNFTPMIQDTCTETGPSVILANNSDVSTMCNKIYKDQSLSVNEDYVKCPNKGRGKSTDRGSGGKHKLADASLDFQGTKLNFGAIGQGSRGRRGRGKGRGREKQILIDGTSQEEMFSENEIFKIELESSDGESNEKGVKSPKDLSNTGTEVRTHLEEGHKDDEIPLITEDHVGDLILHIAQPIDTVGKAVQQISMEQTAGANASMLSNCDSQTVPLNQDSSGSSRRGQGKGRGKHKLFDADVDGREAHTETTSGATGRGRRGGRGKGKRKLNNGTSCEVKFSENEPFEDEYGKVDLMSSEDKDINIEIETRVEDHRHEEIPSIADHHVDNAVLFVVKPLHPAGEDAQQNVMEENAAPENQDNIVEETNVIEEDAAPENQNQGHNDRVLDQNLMQEGDAPANQNRNQNARERFLEIARRRAQHFAFFNSENDGASTSHQRSWSNTQATSDEERRDWPGPFSTARRLVEERERALAIRQEKLVGSGKSASLIEWAPTREKDFTPQARPPSLYDLCLDVLCKHVEFIESLAEIPDAAKNKFCRAFCALRKMTSQTLRLFIAGSPTEISVPDCSLVSEEDLTKLIAQVSTVNLEVLHLGMCGRGLSDRLLQATLASPSMGLPCLTRLSLNGAYRLSDVGLKALVKAAPLLSSVDLSRCSLISEAGVNALVDSLASSIEELRLEDCQQLDAFKILPALKRCQKLEVISVVGMPTVTDEFLTELLAYLGCELKELSLADCGKLTDGALQAIGAVCCRLNALILDNLYYLTDTALVYLTNGCRSLKTLSLKRCSFSDEAVAAFIGASGNNLSDLSLNSVKDVESHTILALVSNARENLSRLDVSWCRKLTDEALGLLADSCPLLEELILFGCTQVTHKFLEGHSNSLLKIIGV